MFAVHLHFIANAWQHQANEFSHACGILCTTQSEIHFFIMLGRYTVERTFGKKHEIQLGLAIYK